jgi:hypothetical protein
MAERSSSTVPIIVAVIGVLGTISAAFIANWDKLSAGRPAQSSASDQIASQNAVAPGTTAQSPNAPVSAEIPVAVDVSGTWVDADGYEYVFEQKGNYYNFRQLKNGTQIGSGSGVLTGRDFTHSFTGVFGEGRCAGQVSSDGNVSSGTCSAGGSTWDFRVVRSAAGAKS